jgi:hypothetical protein
MLAMDSTTPLGIRLPTLSLTTIASMLAPTDRRCLCRSEHARDEPQIAAGYQASSVIVDDHREHARSYSGLVSPRTVLDKNRYFVGAVF